MSNPLWNFSPGSPSPPSQFIRDCSRALGRDPPNLVYALRGVLCCIRCCRRCSVHLVLQKADRRSGPQPRCNPAGGAVPPPRLGVSDLVGFAFVPLYLLWLRVCLIGTAYTLLVSMSNPFNKWRRVESNHRRREGVYITFADRTPFAPSVLCPRTSNREDRDGEES